MRLLALKAGQSMNDHAPKVVTSGTQQRGERLSIACVTSFDPRIHGRNSWSHTLYHMSQVLQRDCGDVTYLGPMGATAARVVGKAADVGYQLLRHRRYMYFHSELVARRFGRVATRRLAQAGRPFDVVLACGAVDVAYLTTDLPIVLVLDATHRLVREYYPAYSNLTERSRRELDTIEHLAIQRAALVLVSSSWAARSVCNDYYADPANVLAFPFGADLEAPPPAQVAEARAPSGHCRLLLLGTNWQRKGGNLAVQSLIALEEMGIEAELVVCGCVPPPEMMHPHMRVIPFLNKRDPYQRQMLESLYLTSDFLLLPTRSDCAPMVFCEAAAYGLPVVTTDTGGVSEIVQDGVTGFTLPHAAAGDAYAAVIARVYRDAGLYAGFVRASRARYDERLNWDAWVKAVAPRIVEVADRGRSRIGASPPNIGATSL